MAGNVQETHPFYDACLADWVRLRVLAAGAREVKEKGDDFLPSLQSHRYDGYPAANSDGYKDYEAYKLRAHFYGYVSKAVRRAMGILHRKPPEFELPPGLDFLRKSATPEGEPLHMLLRNINREQLVTGRCGLLIDAPEDGGASAEPYIAQYCAEKIRNWQDGSAQPGGPVKLRFVVLDESGPVSDLDNLSWINQTKYRVLALTDDNVYGVQVLAQTTGRSSDNEAETSPGLNFNKDALESPIVRGDASDFIPFTFINAIDTVSTPDKPPLYELGEIDVTLYQSDADYRNTLSKQGEETLVTKGQIKGEEGAEGESDIRVGAGARLHLLDLEGDAKYIGIGADGLSEQREAIEKLIERAEHESMSLIEARMAEANATVSQRMAGKTFTLKDLAMAGGSGLQDALRNLAIWRGDDPDKVEVHPNLDFEADELSATDLEALSRAKLGGLRLSNRSIHAKLVQHEWTNNDFETEEKELEEEADDDDQPPGTGAGGDLPDDDGSTGDD